MTQDFGCDTLWHGRRGETLEMIITWMNDHTIISVVLIILYAFLGIFTESALNHSGRHNPGLIGYYSIVILWPLIWFIGVMAFIVLLASQLGERTGRKLDSM